MSYRFLALGVIAAGLVGCQQNIAPVGDISKLVGTWNGFWRGQDGVASNQQGSMTLVVSADGQVTCTLSNATRSGRTTNCSGSMVGNPNQANQVALTADYTYPNEPKITASGVATFLPKDLTINRNSDTIIGAVNNVAAVGGTVSGEVGNLYFSLTK